MQKIRPMPQLLVADKNNKIFDIPHLKATGMKQGSFFRLRNKDLIKLPSGSELFMLPGRLAVGYDPIANGGGWTFLREDALCAKFV